MISKQELQQARSAASPPTDTVSMRLQVSQDSWADIRNKPTTGMPNESLPSSIVDASFVRQIPSIGRIHRQTPQRRTSATLMQTHAASVAILLFSIRRFERPTSTPMTRASSPSRTFPLFQVSQLMTILTLARRSYLSSTSPCTLVIAWIIP